MPTSLRLDDLYRMTAFIYGDRNSTRPKEATFAHFVEVCGMLTVHDRGKRKEASILLTRSVRRWVGTSHFWRK